MLSKIFIPKQEAASVGLEEISMDRLGQIVLLAGKNGSGKTRVLNKIFDTLKRINSTDFQLNKRDIANKKHELEVEKIHLRQAEDKRRIETNSDNIKTIDHEIESLSIRINSLEREIGDGSVEGDENIIDPPGDRRVVPFVPSNLELSDWNNFTNSQLLEKSQKIEIGALTSLKEGTLARIQVVQRNWYNSTHSLSMASAVEKDKAISDYEKLQSYISLFLNTTLGHGSEGEATIFGRPISKANLSAGQTILIQYCLAIYSQESTLTDAIIVLDEPENHLHPSSLIDTIEEIRKHLGNGQIWIATHSIPLLAHYDPSCIWYVDNNNVKHAGKIPEQVLKSLLRDDDEINKLKDFTNLPSELALTHYAFQCLLTPTVSMTSGKDRQSNQIRNVLLSLTQGNQLKILDYGVGRGRLISNILDLDKGDQKDLISTIDYIAYDEFSGDRDECISILKNIFGEFPNRYFGDFTSLYKIHKKNTFDVVVMCNVLHEIDPKEWIDLFKEDGKISQLLSKNGTLLLVEDHFMPVGEKAYERGFLVLDTPQLKELFILESDDRITVDSTSDGRLKAHAIPAKFLSRISEISLKKALRDHSISAGKEILKLRGLDPSYKNGKLHAFWSQQYVNANLTLDELNKTR